MEEEISELEGRIKKLEKDKESRIRFFVQYVLSPILVVVIGIIFNWQIENNKKSVQQIQLAHSMLNTLFSDDEYKILATKRLMDELLASPELKKSIQVMVEEYMEKKLHSSIQKGDVESVKKISEAAYMVGGESGKSIVNKINADPAAKEIISKYDKAAELERKGFEALLKDDIKSAMSNFLQIQQIYPRFHSIDEVLVLLRNNEQQFGDKSMKAAIYKEIVQKHSWKLPKDILNRLESKQGASESR